MASPFEAFVQLELPLRPFAQVDGSQESIPVRRGAGPRQLTFIDLEEGQVLGKVDGMLVGVNATSFTPKKYTHIQTVPDTTWVVQHNLNINDPMIQVIDSTSQVVIPNTITITDTNTVTVTFNSPITGRTIVKE